MKHKLLGGVASILIVSSSIAWAALANHPELLSAEQQVQAAMKSLAAANNGKKEFGKHREEAVELLKKALAQINLASEFADKNPGK
jgi:hypothetical protein